MVTDSNPDRRGSELQVSLEKFHSSEQHSAVRIGPFREFVLQRLNSGFDLGFSFVQFGDSVARQTV